MQMFTWLFHKDLRFEESEHDANKDQWKNRRGENEKEKDTLNR